MIVSLTLNCEAEFVILTQII